MAWASPIRHYCCIGCSVLIEFTERWIIKLIKNKVKAALHRYDVGGRLFVISTVTIYYWLHLIHLIV